MYLDGKGLVDETETDFNNCTKYNPVNHKQKNPSNTKSLIWQIMLLNLFFYTPTTCLACSVGSNAVESVYTCLILYTCGRDWNTRIQLFGWVSGYIWQYSVNTQTSLVTSLRQARYFVLSSQPPCDSPESAARTHHCLDG